MKRKLIILLIITFIISLLTGCQTSREMNELLIATAIGVEKTQDGYFLTVQTLNPKEMASESRTTFTPVTTYHIEGSNLLEAFRRMTTVTPSKIYVSHVRIIVFGEELAKYGLNDLLDFLSRDHEMRGDSLVLVAKNSTPDDILRILTAMENVPSNKVYNALEIATFSWAPLKKVTGDELVAVLMNEGENPVLPGISIEGDKNLGEVSKTLENVNPSAILKIGPLAAFKKDKLVGWLNEDESAGYNYINDTVKGTVEVISCSAGGKIGIEIFRTKSNVNGKVISGKPEINVEIKVEGDVDDVESKIDLSKPESIKELERALEKKILKKAAAAIKKAQTEFDSDIFGFGEAIHRADYKVWKDLKKNWDTEFVSLPVIISVTAELKYGTGKILNPFYFKKEEE